jgi:hypothetical protein
MTACLSHQSVSNPSMALGNLIDHRYFYDELKDGSYIGNYTCGIARNAVAAELRANSVAFTATDFLKSLRDYINNPCVTRFMVEQAVLSSIELKGLAAALGERNSSMTVVMFHDAFPKFRTDTNSTIKPILYCPQKYNFRGIDGIIVWIEPEEANGRQMGEQMEEPGDEKKRKLLMFPLQITTAPENHLDSHKIFFSEYKGWIESLGEFDVVPEFVWITPYQSTHIDHLENSQFNWPPYKERYIHLGQVDKDI